jgi:hypothetical protein
VVVGGGGGGGGGGGFACGFAGGVRFFGLLCLERQQSQTFASSIVCFKWRREISGGWPPEAMKSIDLTLFLRCIAFTAKHRYDFVRKQGCKTSAAILRPAGSPRGQYTSWKPLKDLLTRLNLMRCSQQTSHAHAVELAFLGVGKSFLRVLLH